MQQNYPYGSNTELAEYSAETAADLAADIRTDFRNNRQGSVIVAIRYIDTPSSLSVAFQAATGTLLAAAIESYLTANPSHYLTSQSVTLNGAALTSICTFSVNNYKAHVYYSLYINP